MTEQSQRICKKKKELKSFGQLRNNLAFARDTAAVAPSLQFIQCCHPISSGHQKWDVNFSQ